MLISNNEHGNARSVGTFQITYESNNSTDLRCQCVYYLDLLMSFFDAKRGIHSVVHVLIVKMLRVHHRIMKTESCILQCFTENAFEMLLTRTAHQCQSKLATDLQNPIRPRGYRMVIG